MSHLQWSKLFRDISLNKLRSFFVIIAMFVGIFGLSVVANSYSILLREMDLNYLNTTPASATLWTEELTESQLDEIKSLPYIKDAEIRNRVVGRVQVGVNEWKEIWLFVIRDFNNLRLDTFKAEEGDTIPQTGEILFERKALTFAKLKLGQTVSIKIPGGDITSLDLTGTVHAPGLAPSWMEGFAYGFITTDTFERLGGTLENSELKILIQGDAMDRALIKEISYRLKDYLNNKGLEVSRIDIPKPGKHPHYSQMAALLFLMEALGFISLVLSGVLVANMISSLMEQQKRQIGIMKSIGAESKQIARLYLSMILLFSFTAMLFAIPLGIIVGRGYAFIATEILNFTIYDNTIPYYIYLLEIAVGFLVPILVSSNSVWSISKVTVREALSDYGIKTENYKKKESNSFRKLISYLSRPLMLSVRNTFRRKGRLIFTLLIMAVGGTGFIAAMNIFASMYNTVDEKMNSFRYDLQINFEQPIDSTIAKTTVLSLSGMEAMEAWGGTAASRVYSDQTTGDSFNIIAPPSDTELLAAPAMCEGRWLKPEDTNSIVLNQQLLTELKDIEVGDLLTLRMNQQDTIWNVVGISEELIGAPTAYANMEYLTSLQNSEGMLKYGVIVTKEHSSNAQAAASELLEQELQQKGLPISNLIRLADYRTALENHLVIIASFLIFMSILVVIVGGLGLATTISINTMERTKEIGILRSIGATSTRISSIIVTEGILIGIISWFGSFILSWPVSRFVSERFGLVFFEAPLRFAASPLGYVIWLVLVIVFAALASFYPSRKASGISVRDAISYE